METPNLPNPLSLPGWVRNLLSLPVNDYTSFRARHNVWVLLLGLAPILPDFSSPEEDAALEEGFYASGASVQEAVQFTVGVNSANDNTLEEYVYLRRTPAETLLTQALREARLEGSHAALLSSFPIPQRG